VFQQFKEVLFLFLGECIIMLDSVNVRHTNRGNVRILKITAGPFFFIRHKFVW